MRHLLMLCLGAVFLAGCQTTGGNGELLHDYGNLKKGTPLKGEDGGCRPEIKNLVIPDIMNTEIRFVDGIDQCFTYQIFKSEKFELNGETTLVIALHGDGDNGTSNTKKDLAFARLASVAREKIIDTSEFQTGNNAFITFIREGFPHHFARSSGDRMLYGTRSYTSRHSQEAANAIANIIKTIKASKVGLIGNSGGSAIVANSISLHPELFSKNLTDVILAKCPCDLTKMAIDHGVSRFNGNSISPVDVIENAPKHILLTGIVGARDTNTRPHLTKSLIDKANNARIRTNYIESWGDDHDSLHWSNKYLEQILRIYRKVTS